jgi:hypothetical protein
MKWLKHAFAVDDGPAEPTPEQQPAIDWFCMQVAKRHLTTPGLIGLEMSRPLNFIASQALHFFSPGVWSLVPQRTYEHYLHFATFLEKRSSIDYLCRRIEHFEQELERAASDLKRAPGNTTDHPDNPAEP